MTNPLNSYVYIYTYIYKKTTKFLSESFYVSCLNTSYKVQVLKIDLMKQKKNFTEAKNIMSF